MENMTYQSPALEIVYMTNEDIVSTSIGDELPLDPAVEETPV